MNIAKMTKAQAFKFAAGHELRLPEEISERSLVSKIREAVQVAWDAQSTASAEAAGAAQEAAEPVVGIRTPEPAPKPPERAEELYSIAQLTRYSMTVLGVPSQAIAGAISMGLLREDQVATITEAKAAVMTFMEQEVHQ